MDLGVEKRTYKDFEMEFYKFKFKDTCLFRYGFRTIKLSNSWLKFIDLSFEERKLFCKRFVFNSKYSKSNIFNIKRRIFFSMISCISDLTLLSDNFKTSYNMYPCFFDSQGCYIEDESIRDFIFQIFCDFTDLVYAIDI